MAKKNRKFRIKKIAGLYHVQYKGLLFWHTCQIATQCNAAFWFLPGYVDAAYKNLEQAEYRRRDYERYGYR